MLLFLDLTLFAIHVSVISFNLFGWIRPSWRKAHLAVVLLTLSSWFILGFWYGFGYCFLTDWEWDIKRSLGETNLPHSFITYLTNNLLGLNMAATTVDVITVAAFVPAVVISIYLNVRKWRKG